MNNIEEQLWNYIDGTCTADEQQTISALIAQDEAYRVKYKELLLLNKEFETIELDEPPMAFTYNVMEGIRAEHARQPLKAAPNKRIIIGISIFFLVTLVCLLVYTLANINLPAADIKVTVPVKLKVPELSNYMTKPVVQAFFFIDVILGLFLFDGYLRNKKFAKQA
jgi:hypothetical protein